MSKTIVVDPLAKVTLNIPIPDALYLARAGVAATSTDKITPVITGVLLSAEKGTVKALATDRYRVHRALVEAEGVEFPPFLVPRRALEWLVANGSFFGRGLVDPSVAIEFEQSEPRVDAKGSGTPCPSGFVTVTLSEGSFDTASRLSYRSELIRGNFPSGVEKVLEESVTAETDTRDEGTIDLNFLAKCRALASDRYERPRVRFVQGVNAAKSGQALVVYKRGMALVQKGRDL